MSYIGNKPITQAEKKTQQHSVTASKTIYPVSGGYSVGLIDVFLNGVLLLDKVDYSAGDGLNVNLFIATTNDDTLVTVAWGAFVVADVVQPNDVRLATAWCRFNGILTGTNPPIDGFNVASVTRNGVGDYTINFTNDMDNLDFSIVSTSTSRVMFGVAPSVVGSCNVGSYSLDTAAAIDAADISVIVFGGKN